MLEQTLIPLEPSIIKPIKLQSNTAIHNTAIHWIAIEQFAWVCQEVS
jgi:hypothetical protein